VHNVTNALRVASRIRRETLKPGMGSRGFKEKLEMTTNIMVIAGVLLFSFVVYRSLTNHAKFASDAPAVKTVLPALPGYSWDGHSQILLLVP
jgi:hypothetical protein